MAFSNVSPVSACVMFGMKVIKRIEAINNPTNPFLNVLFIFFHPNNNQIIGADEYLTIFGSEAGSTED